MKISKIIVSLVIILTPFTVFSENNINSKLQKTYTKFYTSVSKKYKYDKWLAYLKKLNRSIIKIKKSSKVNSKNFKLINDLHKLNNEKIFFLELNKKEINNKIKINWTSLLNDYKHFFYNNEWIVKEDWVWYAYIYERKYYFENISRVDKKTLEYNWLVWDDILVFYDNNKLNFIKNYKKEKLISDDIIYWIPNKYDFLKTLKNNRIFVSWDDDKAFLELKKLSNELTSWIYDDDKKIEKIYSYIIETTDYTEKFTLQDYQIFSWIETFKNKNWVCEWYVELLNIILNFNNIESNILTWDVINAQDFPKIWHAWIKIWDYYYDPTFDDPIWIEMETNKNNPEYYLYYKLPKDLFYTNRYDYWTLPSELKTTKKDYREKIIKENLSKLEAKYLNKKYNILKPFTFRKKYSINYNDEISIEKLKNIIWISEMTWFEIKINWKTKEIKNINYITLNDWNIEHFLKKINYDLTWYILIKWEKEDSNIEYIITNNITYH